MQKVAVGWAARRALALELRAQREHPREALPTEPAGLEALVVVLCPGVAVGVRRTPRSVRTARRSSARRGRSAMRSRSASMAGPA